MLGGEKMYPKCPHLVTRNALMYGIPSEMFFEMCRQDGQKKKKKNVSTF